MKIKLKSKELVKIRKDLKDAMVVHGEQQKALVKLDKEHKKNAFKINRIKEKGLKILDKMLQEQHEMTEFDYFVNYESTDAETLECEIRNLYEDTYGDLDAVKKKMREDKKNKEGLWANDETLFIGHKKTKIGQEESVVITTADVIKLLEAKEEKMWK